MDNKSSRLWTKNFTIITLGTVVSALGNAISGFSISLMVLGHTSSTFLFAVFMVVYNLPKIFMPLVAGPYLDRFSRARVIYTLDFISSGIYLLIFFMLRADIFLYVPFLMLAFLIGSIDSVYQVAYDSLYPTLVSKENYSKAYSISSIIYPLTSVVVLVAAFLYDRNGLDGLTVLFLFNAVTFFVAAMFETQIRAPKPEGAEKGEQAITLKGYGQELRAGLTYINGEKGLKVITAYFFVNLFAYAASGVVVLPYFMAHDNLKMLWYTYVMGGGVIGRIVGGSIQYNIKYPAKIRYGFSIFIYIAVALVEGSYLFFPALVMMGMNFISGILAVTSQNMRVAATQSYVPDTYRGRFNGTFQMVCTTGTILGQLLAGAMADLIDGRTVLAAFMGINILAVLTILVPGRKHVKPIFNREV